MSKAKALSKALGGRWKYDGMTAWWCDDGRRHVARVCAGVDEFDHDVGPPQYWLYEKDNPPVRAEGYLGYRSWWQCEQTFLL